MLLLVARKRNKERVGSIMSHKPVSGSKLAIVKSVLGIVIGAGIAAIGLEAFLIPNSLTDGGVVGVSIIASEVFNMPIGVFLILVNIPFIYLGYKKLGKLFAVASMFGIAMLAGLTTVLHHDYIATTDPLLAAVFGGVVVGAGVGFVIRYGGTMDGTEIIAILGDKKLPFSVGEIIMFINIFILGTAGFVFGWDKAMYSFVAYFVAYKVIDMTVEGLDESKSAWIVSTQHQKLGEVIQAELRRKVTYIEGQRATGYESDGMILTVISRIEEQKLKDILHRHDPNAFVVISNVHEVMGKNYLPKPHLPAN